MGANLFRVLRVGPRRVKMNIHCGISGAPPARRAALRPFAARNFRGPAGISDWPAWGCGAMAAQSIRSCFKLQCPAGKLLIEFAANKRACTGSPGFFRIETCMGAAFPPSTQPPPLAGISRLGLGLSTNPTLLQVVRATVPAQRTTVVLESTCEATTKVHRRASKRRVGCQLKLEFS